VSDLLLTLVRLGFLALIWCLVLVAVIVLRRDLRAPRDARPLVVAERPRSRGESRAAPRPRAEKGSRPSKSEARTLVVIEGPLAGTVIPLGSGDITLGRAPDSTLVLDDDYASSAHARVRLTSGSWIVEDLGSTNGTWIDRTRLTGPTPLTVGRQLKVGRTVLELRR